MRFKMGIRRSIEINFPTDDEIRNVLKNKNAFSLHMSILSTDLKEILNLPMDCGLNQHLRARKKKGLFLDLCIDKKPAINRDGKVQQQLHYWLLNEL